MSSSSSSRSAKKKDSRTGTSAASHVTEHPSAVPSEERKMEVQSSPPSPAGRANMSLPGASLTGLSIGSLVHGVTPTEPPIAASGKVSLTIFGQPIGKLPTPTLLDSSDKFAEFKCMFVNYATLNNIDSILLSPSADSWNEAMAWNVTVGVPEAQLFRLYRRLHLQVIASIKMAIYKIINNTV